MTDQAHQGNNGSPLLIIQSLTVPETLTIRQAEWPTVRQIEIEITIPVKWENKHQTTFHSICAYVNDASQFTHN